MIESLTPPRSLQSTLKLIALGLLALMLMIPLLMIQQVIGDRRSLQHSAEHEVAERIGGEQRLAGPWLVVPTRTERQTDDGKRYIEERSLWLAPEQLTVSGAISSEVRRLGLYEVPIYDAQLKLAAQFDVRRLPAARTGETLMLDQASWVIAVSSARGLRALTTSAGPLEPWTAFGDSLHALLSTAAGGKFDALEIEMRSGGTRTLRFAPVGATTSVNLSGDWPDIGYVGAHAVARQRATEQGFTATWEVLEINRQLPRISWALPGNLEAESFGLSMVVEASTYQQSERTLKYGFLFIVLTFAGYFLFELVSSRRVHLIQYALIGAALALFYLLQLALAEVIGFGLAYLSATLALCAMVGAYSAAFMREVRSGAVAGIALGLTYGVLYGLVISERYALLLGALVLFLVLATIMALTARIDWYGATNRNAVEGPS